jgi:glutathione S-transferase
MAGWKADRSTERGARRAETNAAAVYLAALRAPVVPARSRARPVQRRTQVEQWLSEGELSPNEELRLVQRRLDIDAGLARLDEAYRLPELEEAFVKVAAPWCKHNEITAAALRQLGVPAACFAKAGV